MKLRLLELREQLQTSIWFIPLLLCITALCLAVVMLWIERELQWHLAILQTFSMEVTSARNVLGVIAGSVLSVGGVVFSVTMVALTLTSGQYGPKVLRQFLGDDVSKVSLGMFLGTSLYCLLVLAAYQDSDQPSVTVVTALILTIVALGGFIRFIHHTATDLQADQIIQRIGADLNHSLAELTAQKNLDGRRSDTVSWRKNARGKRGIAVASKVDGYVQGIDYAGLVTWCMNNKCVAHLTVRAGDFLLPGTSLLKLYGLDNTLNEEAVNTLRGYIRCGPMRNPVQDPEFPITQLNQLAARALSPGINDPGTAITCIDWFSMALSRIVDRDMPGRIFLDEKDEPRLLVRFTDFPGILKAFYAPSRQFACDNIPVLISLADSLIRLSQLTTRQCRLDVLCEQGELLLEAVERGQHADHDLRDFRQRYHKLIRQCRRLT